MSVESRLPITNPNKLTLINVAGVCHGPKEYAISLIHQRVFDSLQASGADIKEIFVASTVMNIDEETNNNEGLQQPPSRQLEDLHEAVEEAKRAQRIPVALAHSTGSIATLAALHEGFLSYAVFVSPIFLDPRMELLGSHAFSRRLNVLPDENGRLYGMMHPDKMNYPTIFPSDHLDDPLYWNTIASKPQSVKETKDLLDRRMKIFVGQHDWNVFKNRYIELFDAEVVEDEAHSFEQNPKSVEKVSRAILKLIDTVYFAK